MTRTYLLLLLSLLIALTGCLGDDEDWEEDEFDDQASAQMDDQEGDDEDWDWDWDWDEWDDEEWDDEEVENDQPRRPTAVGQSFTETNCPISVNARLTCGYLAVPENRTNPNSNTIELAVAILHPPGRALADPVIYLAGGPGGSALDDLEWDLESWTSYGFAQNRALIFLDQRGTGHSQPSLNCYELDDEDTAEEAEELCYYRLVDEGLDLSGYNSIESATDVAELMLALGYNEWNVLGISYGTRLALTLMRDHPQGIRSVFLDSPFPPNARTPEEEALHSYNALRALFRACANDRDCDAEYPDLEEYFIELVADLNANPDEIEGDELVVLVLAGLNGGSYYIPLLPLLIYQVGEGDYDLFDELQEDLGYHGSSWPGLLTSTSPNGRPRQGEDVSDSEGMYHAVTCREEFAFGNLAQIEREVLPQIPEPLHDALFYGGTGSQFEICELWDVGRAPAIENQAVVSDIPTLILVGEFDPVTPPAWGRLAAQTLRNGYYFEFPGAGHSLLSDMDCAIEMMDAFFDNPRVRPDDSCMAGLADWAFEMP